MRELDGITNVMDVNLGKLQEMVRNRQVWQAAVHGVAKSLMQLGNWTACILIIVSISELVIVCSYFLFLIGSFLQNFTFLRICQKKRKEFVHFFQVVHFIGI